MKNILFASDLDNTLLFSHRHRAEGDVSVEWLEGREQSFCTRRVLAMLRKLERRALVIPVTSRSMEQYRRIAWAQSPKYAVTTNGGVLLVDGRPDEAWRSALQSAVAPWQEEMARVYEALGAVAQAARARVVDGMYVFAACENSQDAMQVGERLEGRTALEVAVSGRKVYFFPPPVNKGAALRRLRERFSPSKIICAGDSVIDCPMLRAADVAIVPEEALLKADNSFLRCVFDGNGRFSDFVLQQALLHCAGEKGGAARTAATGEAGEREAAF